MEYIISIFGTCIQVFEHVKEWCYREKQSPLNFIETNRKEILFSFNEIDVKKTDYVTVNFTMFQKYYKIIVEVDDCVQSTFDYILKSTQALPVAKTPKLSKTYILSAAAIRTDGQTQNITDVMNQLAGPNGDFYEYAGYKFPKESILGYLNQITQKEFRQISFVDCEGDTHIMQ